MPTRCRSFTLANFRRLVFEAVFVQRGRASLAASKDSFRLLERRNLSAVARKTGEELPNVAGDLIDAGYESPIPGYPDFVGPARAGWDDSTTMAVHIQLSASDCNQ